MTKNRFLVFTIIAIIIIVFGNILGIDPKNFGEKRKEKKSDFDKKFVFIHGYGGSSGTDWFPGISSMLDDLGIEYSIPDLSGEKQPHSRDWLEIIDREVRVSKKPVILVGYSLGTRAELLYLDRYKKKVDSVFLVAPLSNEIKNAKRNGGIAYPDFFEYKIDLARIKNLARKFVIIHSKDDPAVDYRENAFPLAKELGAKIIAYKDRGHFNNPGAGSENASEILKVLRKELEF